MKGIVGGERNPCLCSEGETRIGVGPLTVRVLELAAVRGKRAGKSAFYTHEGVPGWFCHPISLCQG